MAKANRLNKRVLDRIMAEGKPRTVGDGNTLFLRVRGDSAAWVQIIHMNGKRTERGLGGYPIVSLEKARNIAFDNRRAVKEGRNPWQQKQTIKSKVPTFADGLDAVIAKKRTAWKDDKNEQQWRASIKEYASSLLAKRVDAIEADDVYACLEPIWSTKHVTACRVKTRISAVMKWAIFKGYREENPAANVDSELTSVRRKTNHHKALPYKKVPAAIAKIAKNDGYVGTNLALRFLILTATRSQETRLARWNEISQDGLTWTIPADRMKADNEHVVPLSEAALAVLDEAEDEFGTDGLMFPSLNNKTQANRYLGVLLRDCGIDATVHGFRSSFRDWSAENDYDRDIAEAALAHKVRNQVEAAYRRTNFLEKRRKMMERWGEFCVSV